MGYRDPKRTRSAVFPPGPPEEDYRARHKQRLEFNLQAKDWVEEEAAALGLSLRITNEGHHWQFRGGLIQADWWPSSAKLVIDSKWRKGIHVHDHHRLIQELTKAIEAKSIQRNRVAPKNRRQISF